VLVSEESVLHQITGPDVVWSRVNTAESVVGVQTPLSWSFWDEGGELGFRLAYCELGFLAPSALMIPDAVDAKFTALFFGRGATNVSAFRAALDAMPFAATDDAEQSFFASRDVGVRERSPRRRRWAATWRLPLAALRLAPRLARVRRESARFWSESLARLPEASLSESVALVEQARERFSEEVAAQIVASTVATLFSSRLQAKVERLEAERGIEGQDLELRLLGGFGEMEEIRVAADLWQVARGGRDLGQFLADHGFRGPADGELSSHSWREDAGPIETLVAPYRSLPESKSPVAAQARRVADREDAAREVLGGLRGIEAVRTQALLKLAAHYIPLRVIAKAAFQQTFDVARAAARRIGALHVSAGRLDRAEDVFYLIREELLEPPEDVRARVEARRALRQGYEEWDQPLEFTGMPEPFALQSAAGVLGKGGSISGLGVSSGRVEGVARVVLDPSEGELLPGEVLVCATTDPSWSSYFLIASAVVIDVGGPLSHGAIVARELDIPCVINVVDGTHRLQSGDRVRVDGSRGTVEVLEAAQA